MKKGQMSTSRIILLILGLALVAILIIGFKTNFNAFRPHYTIEKQLCPLNSDQLNIPISLKVDTTNCSQIKSITDVNNNPYAFFCQNESLVWVKINTTSNAKIKINYAGPSINEKTIINEANLTIENCFIWKNLTKVEYNATNFNCDWEPLKHPPLQGKPIIVNQLGDIFTFQIKNTTQEYPANCSINYKIMNKTDLTNKWLNDNAKCTSRTKKCDSWFIQDYIVRRIN